jgi:exosome complex exonuclease DIS3/RRP44
MSDDAGNRRAAETLCLKAMSTKEYVATVMPDDRAVVLGDLVAELGSGLSASNVSGQEGSLARQPKTTYAPNYLPMSTLQAGVKAGNLHQGYFNLDPYNFREGSVKVPAFGKAVLLVGSENTNRSVTGDYVVVEVLPESEWKAPADEVLDEECKSGLSPFTLVTKAPSCCS